jgi:hypothetical protein
VAETSPLQVLSQDFVWSALLQKTASPPGEDRIIGGPARRQYARPNVPFQLQDLERAIGTSYPFKSSMCVPAYVVTASCYYNLDAALQNDDAAIQQRGFDVVAI